MYLKVWAQGWSPYWRVWQNRFDFAITWTVLPLQVIERTPGLLEGYDVIRYVQLLRIARLVRLFKYIPQYRVVLRTAHVVLPSLFQLTRLLLLLFFVFALLGVQLFGGMMRDHGRNPELVGSTYEESHYEVFNFNDFTSALVLLFNLLLQNDWHVYMLAYVQASHSTKNNESS
eukprot:4527656-Pyramimonas_sp.AAC.2